MNKYRFKSGLLLLMFVSILPAQANKPIRITPEAGEKQVFEGFGFNGASFTYMQPLYETWMSEAVKDTLNYLLYKDCSLKFLRPLWTNITQWDDEYIVSNFKNEIERKLRYVPDLQIIFDPAGVMTSPEQWGKRIAEVIYAMEHGIRNPVTGKNLRIDYTGIGNEPNQQQYRSAAPIAASSVDDVIIGVRKALDEKGLTHVKVIAPGASNVDNYMKEAVKAINTNAKALQSLYAYEYHAYNMSLTEDLANEMALHRKKIFQSESSLPEGDHDFIDSMSAAQTYTRFLADINRGVCNFVAWMDWREWPGDFGAETIKMNSYTGEIRPYLKFYYLRQLSRTFVPGTRMRKCVTDLPPRISAKKDTTWEDRYMEYSYGLKIPFAAAIGVRPDGTWVMAAINHTGIRFNDYGSTYYPKTDYDVTFSIPELAGSGDIQLKVWRCNNGSRNVFDDPVVMHNGEVTVPLRHCDLVCLSTTFDTTFAVVPGSPVDDVDAGSCGSCGTGIGLAFFPPIGFSTFSAIRRRRRQREVRRV